MSHTIAKRSNHGKRECWTCVPEYHRDEADNPDPVKTLMLDMCREQQEVEETQKCLFERFTREHAVSFRLPQASNHGR